MSDVSSFVMSRDRLLVMSGVGGTSAYRFLICSTLVAIIDIVKYIAVCISSIFSIGAMLSSDAPAPARLIYALVPKVDGNMYENISQNLGKHTWGHENPVRKSSGKVRKSNATIGVSLCLTNVLHAIEKNTHAVT